MHSHVSRSENLEKLSISRTLSSVGISSFSSAVWKMQDVRESRADRRTQELSESSDIFGHI